jgi:hypothetical protein
MRCPPRTSCTESWLATKTCRGSERSGVETELGSRPGDRKQEKSVRNLV